MTSFKAMLYVVATLTCIACTILLVREYARTRFRLLLWSALCFVGLSINNALVYVDMVMYPELDLRLLRATSALVGMAFLLYGFIWEAEA